jgi:Sec-independent protein translocase protein TatA
VNILGIGGTELLLIVVVMLIFAGPKRMVQWAYVLGRYVAIARRMWQEAIAGLQNELKSTGIDVDVSRATSPRAMVQQFVSDMTCPISKPIEDTTAELRQDLSMATPRADADAPKKSGAVAEPAPGPVKPRPATPPPPRRGANAMWGAWQGSEHTPLEGTVPPAGTLGDWSAPSAEDPQ